MDHRTDEADAPAPGLQHVLHELKDARGVVHEQYIRAQQLSVQPYRGVHKEQGELQSTQHPGVIPIEDLHAHNAAGALPAEGGGQAQAVHLGVGEVVHGHHKAHLGQLPLKLVQQGGRKVRAAHKAPGEQSDFARMGLLRLRWALCRRERIHEIEVRKLLVAQLSGFLENLFPGGAGQPRGVVDGFGHGVPGHPKGVRNVLYGDSAGQGHPSFPVPSFSFRGTSIAPGQAVVKCTILLL